MAKEYCVIQRKTVWILRWNGQTLFLKLKVPLSERKHAKSVTLRKNFLVNQRRADDHVKLNLRYVPIGVKLVLELTLFLGSEKSLFSVLFRARLWAYMTLASKGQSMFTNSKHVGPTLPCFRNANELYFLYEILN